MVHITLPSFVIIPTICGGHIHFTCPLCVFLMYLSPSYTVLYLVSLCLLLVFSALVFNPAFVPRALSWFVPHLVLYFSFHLSYPRLSGIKGGQEEIQRPAEREDKRSHLQSYVHVHNKSWRQTLGSWRNLTLKDAPGLETRLKPCLLQINLHWRKTEMCLTLKYETGEMEKLKAPLRDGSLYYSNPPTGTRERAGKCHTFWSDVIKVHYRPRQLNADSFLGTSGSGSTLL